MKARTNYPYSVASTAAIVLNCDWEERWFASKNIVARVTIQFKADNIVVCVDHGHHADGHQNKEHHECRLIIKLNGDCK